MCNCNKKSMPAQRQAAPPRVARDVRPAITVKAIPEPKAKVGPVSFCKTCGWAIKSVRFYDMASKRAIDKSICTNRSCVHHR